ncbi:hypothetical protein D3C78_557800 [compost metagenome]
MLGELEDLIQARLGELREQLPRLRLDSYGGELSDPDLLPSLLKGGPAVLITIPRMKFEQRSNRRFALAVVFRLVIACRQPRGERETRRGIAADRHSPGSYALWEACLAKMVGWQPWLERAAVVPTEFSNLVNGTFQGEHYSVLGQSFSVDAAWTVPDDDNLPDLTGIDLYYHLPPDAPEPLASDRVNLT